MLFGDGGEDVLIPIEVCLFYIQGPPIQKFGEGTDLWVGTTGETQRPWYGYSVAPKYIFLLRSKGMVKRVADTFRGCCQQTFGSPRQLPHTCAAKICIKKGWTEPAMLTYYPQDHQNCEY